MVHEIIKKQGLKLVRERKDQYVGELAQYMKRNNIVLPNHRTTNCGC
jgi:tRNA-(ms[2]io[6]A)-hydroxylase